MQVRWLSKAADDLESISRYLKKHAPHVAYELVSGIYQAVESLASMPYKGRPRSLGMRELPLLDSNYLVTYKIKGDTVLILSPSHGT